MSFASSASRRGNVGRTTFVCLDTGYQEKDGKLTTPLVTEKVVPVVREGSAHILRIFLSDAGGISSRGNGTDFRLPVDSRSGAKPRNLVVCFESEKWPWAQAEILTMLTTARIILALFCCPPSLKVNSSRLPVGTSGRLFVRAWIARRQPWRPSRSCSALQVDRNHCAPRLAL